MEPRKSSDPSPDNQPQGGAPVTINEDTDLSTLSAAQVYDLNQRVLDSISDVQRPLIADLANISDLRAEYERGSPSFVQQIDYLEKRGYHSIRRTRGDGDCFYRSVAFAFVENLLHSPDRGKAVETALAILSATPKMLENVGFEKLVFEDFYEVLETLAGNIVTPGPAGTTLDDTTLLAVFQNNTTSNSIVMYLRMLTSAQLRLDPDSYAPFLFHPELGEPMEVREFCEHFVEATGKEADHVQMTALSRALQINIDIAYLDGRGVNGAVEFVKFQDAKTKLKPICLLYRPGHYDILVKDV
ncbi:otubain-like cysteine protease [Moniliophthora roreri]|uniref:ubiquitinyl hydrolase 1 n=1 Tax=Moniliophthora roreri TaxID=221103 RepID=A0A0W0G1T6_MONRR|nr:otubain-like cysteine protease [Moniliophthora roreri]